MCTIYLIYALHDGYLNPELLASKAWLGTDQRFETTRG